MAEKKEDEGAPRVIISVRVEPALYAAIRAAADADGRPISSYVRKQMQILLGLRKKTRPRG